MGVFRDFPLISIMWQYCAIGAIFTIHVEEKDQPKKNTLTQKSELVKESHPDPEAEPLKRNTPWI